MRQTSGVPVDWIGVLTVFGLVLSVAALALVVVLRGSDLLRWWRRRR
ncbi:hypothetical protein DFR76_10719 [Nocardia pseudobrasiliensis]|uniref:Uncharacterized protein n=1 Tax=Nocardia pseudobrasiliensis TaxID=45979 RepID=A0A370I5N7_9NOCA|nr:hypothetical protein DFR76_10719 [Nocardia pseudobrasiliensis]